MNRFLLLALALIVSISFSPSSSWAQGFEVITWEQLPEEKKAATLAGIQEVFYLTGKVDAYPSAEAKAKHFRTFAGEYINVYPEHFHVALDQQTGRVLGYIAGCPDSAAMCPFFQEMAVPVYDLFSDQFERSSCHLHINCHPGDANGRFGAQGRGVGRALMNALKAQLKEQGHQGLHAVTTPNNPGNAKFYAAMGFGLTDEDYVVRKAPSGAEVVLVNCPL